MATLEELLASYKGQQSMASTLASAAPTGALSALSGGLGLVGAIAAPYITDALTSGMNRRSPAEEAALKSIRDVAEGGRTAAQSTLEYERGRAQRQVAQAAAQAPARQRASTALTAQENQLEADTRLSGMASATKMQEQQAAQRALADIETRAGEAERQRQRQMMAGAVSGGLGALSQAYGGYLAGKQRQGDLEAQAAGAGEAVKTIESAMKTTSQPLSAATAAPVVAPAAPGAVAAPGVIQVQPPVTLQSTNSMGIGQQPAPYGRVMPTLPVKTDLGSGPPAYSGPFPDYQKRQRTPVGGLSFKLDTPAFAGQLPGYDFRKFWESR